MSFFNFKIKIFSFRVVVVLLLSSFLVSCGGDISKVKNSRLGLDESVSIANALENYSFFSDTEWDSFKDDQKRRYVEFSGTFNIKKLWKEDEQGFLDSMGWLSKNRNADPERTWHYNDPYYPENKRSELVNFLLMFKSIEKYSILDYMDPDNNMTETDIREMAKYSLDEYAPWSEDETKLLNLLTEGKVEEARKFYSDLLDFKVDLKGSELIFKCQFLMNGKNDFELSGIAIEGTFKLKDPDLSESFFADLSHDIGFLKPIYMNELYLVGQDSFNL